MAKPIWTVQCPSCSGLARADTDNGLCGCKYTEIDSDGVVRCEELPGFRRINNNLVVRTASEARAAASAVVVEEGKSEDELHG